jgi:hypothetical protein
MRVVASSSAIAAWYIVYMLFLQGPLFTVGIGRTRVCSFAVPAGSQSIELSASEKEDYIINFSDKEVAFLKEVAAFLGVASHFERPAMEAEAAAVLLAVCCLAPGMHFDFREGKPFVGRMVRVYAAVNHLSTPSPHREPCLDRDHIVSVISAFPSEKFNNEVATSCQNMGTIATQLALLRHLCLIPGPPSHRQSGEKRWKWMRRWMLS